MQNLLRSDERAGAIGALRRVRVAIIQREVAAGDFQPKLVAALDSRGSMPQIYLYAITPAGLKRLRIQLGIAKTSALDTDGDVLRKPIRAHIDQFDHPIRIRRIGAGPDFGANRAGED